jgi:hypothetical protein
VVTLIAGSLVGCSGSAKAEAFPDGVYRQTITRQDILAALPHVSEQLIRNNAGTMTYRFSHGRITWRQRPQYPTNSGTRGAGTYRVKGDVFVVRWSTCMGCPPVETIRWKWDGRLLRLHKNTEDEGDILVWNVKPLVKIA